MKVQHILVKKKYSKRKIRVLNRRRRKKRRQKLGRSKLKSGN